MPETSEITENTIWEYLKEVEDPEIPVLNVVEMGIVRAVNFDGDKAVVSITPTYSGCPAMSAIEQAIRVKLVEKNVPNLRVRTDYTQAWTSDWITDEARQKLRDYGIAPPDERSIEGRFTDLEEKTIPCPFCDSLDTRLESKFGSTACKAQLFCDECRQPFEHFKCI